MLDSRFVLKDLQAACRICLQNNENEYMAHIFEASQGCDLTIGEQIEKCVGIRLKHSEKLSSSICKNCLAFLKVAYKFRSICWNSQNYLQEFVLKQTNGLEPIEIESRCLEEEHLGENRLNITSDSSAIEKEQTLCPQTTTSNEKSTNCDIEDNSISTFTHSEEYGNEYFGEWLDGGKILDDVTINDPNTNTACDDIKEKVKFKFKNKLNTTTCKTLGISPDGAAVIEEKASSPSVTKRTRKEKRTHICEICGNIYDRRYSLVAHMRRHKDEKPYECEICGQAFHCNFELSRHIRKHTGLRPYVCGYCKRAFGDRSTLLKHERIHRNERPYSCGTCGKTFTYSSVLKVHQLTHTGEKPYNCQLCGKRFSRSHHLRAHLETLLHQNDPQTKELLKGIKPAEEDSIRFD